jgi:hypothetical protein
VVDRAAEVNARNGRAVDLRRPVVARSALAGDGDRRELIGKGADDGGFRSPRPSSSALSCGAAITAERRLRQTVAFR